MFSLAASFLDVYFSAPKTNRFNLRNLGFANRIGSIAYAVGTLTASRVARERKSNLMLILLILLIVLLIGATPAWPYSRGWGYYPTGVLGTILVIFLVLLLLGQVSL